MYLHNILRRDESQLLSQVFKAQFYSPIKGDWTEQVKKDLEEFGLNHLDLNPISKMKKRKV